MRKKNETSELLQQLMDNITDHIYFKDLDSRFILMNKADSKWLGVVSPEEAIGKTDFDFFEEEHAQAYLQDEKRIMETGEPMIGIEEEEIWEDGHATWVSTTKIPLRNKDGEITGCIGIGRDITERKEQEFKLKAYAKELKKYNQQLKALNDQMQEDLEMAANLQQAFFPQSYPSFTTTQGTPLVDFFHYDEADVMVGGDFCSIHKLSDTTAGLLIGDVMGHGVRSALITGIIKALTDQLLDKPHTPGELLTELNRQLSRIIRPQEAYMFVSASYLIVNVQTGKLDGALAGHTHPIRVNPANNDAALLEINERHIGPALSIDDQYIYPTFSSQLSPDESLLLYTDGIIEATNALDDEFGTDRFLRTIQTHCTLPIQQIIKQSIEKARDFSAHKKFNDDICMLGFTLRQ